MIRILCLAVITLICSSSLNSQQIDQVLIEIGEEVVTLSEFERIYKKNNQMVSDLDKKSLEEYFELFLIYKLKVAEAKKKGLDQTDNFKQELASYRNQLIRNQLVDSEVEEEIVREAYERLKYEVSASHILISIPEQATPEDTLMLYEKTLRIRNRVLSGEKFQEVARATSDDPSVKRNGGMLGYFSAFQMVYPFESAAFNTPVGTISMPIRSQFGYHIIKVHDKRPTLGQVKAAHIMIATPQNATEEQKEQAKEKIKSIYAEVLNNEDFSELARNHSQDPGSARNGGELPWFGSGRMVPEFEKVAFSLEEPGQTSEPFQTPFGWHIVKLLEKKTVGTFQEMYSEILTRVNRDERGRISRTAFVEKLKDKYNFTLDSTSLKTAKQLIDSTVYKGNWEIPSSYMNRHLFTFSQRMFTLKNFEGYLSANSNRLRNAPIESIVERMFNEMVEEIVIAYQENKIIENDPEIRYLLKEYHDGILLFEIMEQNVWNKASEDLEGLEKFYQSNINNYKWDKLISAKVYTAVNEETAKKAKKRVTSWRGRRLSDKDFVKRWFVEDGDTLLAIETSEVFPDDPIAHGYEQWENGISAIYPTEGGNIFLSYQGVKSNVPKPLNEIRGQVIADYQDFLEKEWIEYLRQKHTVKVNTELLEQISSSLN